MNEFLVIDVFGVYALYMAVSCFIKPNLYMKFILPLIFVATVFITRLLLGYTEFSTESVFGFSCVFFISTGMVHIQPAVFTSITLPKPKPNGNRCEYCKTYSINVDKCPNCGAPK